MKILFLIGCFWITFDADAQKKYNYDSLTIKLCESFNGTSNFPDTLRIEKTFENYSYLFNYLSETEIRNVYSVLYLRLQMSCPGFDKITESGSQTSNDNITIDSNIRSKLNSKQCSDLFKSNKYYYFDGDSKVNLFITDSTWTSLFSDGTFSELSLKMINECEFIITLLESNNYIISNSLKSGHQYRYKIIEEFQTYYILITEDISTRKKQLFKLYK